ncbi:flippase-like domain-containing protein [bacterium]|nr:flippase-like domain-containing protein [bacterium]
MKSSRYKSWIRLVGVLLGGCVLYFALRSVRLQELAVALTSNINEFLVLCILSWIASILFQAWRWQIMLNAQRSVAFNSALMLYLINRLTNLLFLFRAGEGIRVATGSKKLQINAPYLIATIVNERILNFVFLALIALGLTFSLPFLEPIRVWLVGGLLTLLPLGWWVIQKTKDTSNPREVEQIAHRTSRLKQCFHRFMTGIAILKKPAILRGVVLTSVGSWCCLWLGIWCLVQNLQPSSHTMAALAVLLLINIAGLLPITPSSVGPFQWACILALSHFGVAQTEAVAFSLILQAVRIIAAVLLSLGGVSADYLHFPPRRKKYLAHHEVPH